MSPFLATATSNGVDWLNLVYVLTATIIAAGVIVRSVRKMARKVMEDVFTELVKPHLDEDNTRFSEINVALAEIRGRSRRAT